MIEFGIILAGVGAVVLGLAAGLLARRPARVPVAVRTRKQKR